MRRSLEVDDPRSLRLHDHAGWCAEGPSDFDRLATAFLAEGLEAREQLCWIADEVERSRLAELGDVDELIATGRLLMVRAVDAYGAGRARSDGHRPLGSGPIGELIAASSASAAAAGFSGIRLISDVTSFVADESGVDRWLGWEAAADRALARHGVVALCAYDRHRITKRTLELLAAVHPIISASHGPVAFRLFADERDPGVMQLRGSVDGLSAPRFARVLRCAALQVGDGPFAVDVGGVDFLNHSALVALHALASSGVEIVVRRPQAQHLRLWELLDLPPAPLRFER